jgi:hypothetical protein
LGDYEYTFVITHDEAEELLEKGQAFVRSPTRYLNQEGSA